MDYQVLKTELALATYNGMTDIQATTELNAVDKDRNATSVSGQSLLEAMDSAEYGTLTDTQKSQWLALCAIDNHNPWGQAGEVAKDIWTGKGTTLAALIALRTETVSQATILGLPELSESGADVNHARALP